MRNLSITILALAALAPIGFAMPGEVIDFCDATANSTGNQAVLQYTGSLDYGAADVRFMTSDMPAGNFCMLMMSYGSVDEYPFGQGVLCLNPYYPTGLYRVSDAMLATGTDDEAPAFLPSAPQIGQWHYFQTFYRDHQAGGFNSSTALGILFDVPD